MKYSSIMILVGIATLATGAPSAQAACECICMEGTARTVCNDQTEASSGQNLCLVGKMQAECPAPEGAIDSDVDVTTPSGTENCVRARVYDPKIREYKEVNVCDLAG